LKAIQLDLQVLDLQVLDQQSVDLHVRVPNANWRHVRRRIAASGESILLGDAMAAPSAGGTAVKRSRSSTVHAWADFYRKMSGLPWPRNGCDIGLTTALRAPANYGLRGWISALSRSGPAASFMVGLSAA
jgi:hypothetical protein